MRKPALLAALVAICSSVAFAQADFSGDWELVDGMAAFSPLWSGARITQDG